MQPYAFDCKAHDDKIAININRFKQNLHEMTLNNDNNSAKFCPKNQKINGLTIKLLVLKITTSKLL